MNEVTYILSVAESATLEKKIKKNRAQLGSSLVAPNEKIKTPVPRLPSKKRITTTSL